MGSQLWAATPKRGMRAARPGSGQRTRHDPGQVNEEPRHAGLRGTLQHQCGAHLRSGRHGAGQVEPGLEEPALVVLQARQAAARDTHTKRINVADSE